MIELTGLHLLLAYHCTNACDHCFVWGSPRQRGVFTIDQIRQVITQARDTGTITRICFEGGEPFLYYPVLVEGVRLAADAGFKVGLVTNGYWATAAADARQWLAPFAGRVQDILLSCDNYHQNRTGPEAANARAAAAELGIKLGVSTIGAAGDPAPGEGGVMYRGRAAAKLAGTVAQRPWAGFTSCPHENLRQPSRCHLDAFGNLHLCQGLVIGNLWRTPLHEICAAFDADTHPVVGPLVRGGPAELARHFRIPPAVGYADACHLCYDMRAKLRPQFPETLGPDPMYGEAP
jgi:hypothetical protein